MIEVEYNISRKKTLWQAVIKQEYVTGRQAELKSHFYVV